MGKMIKWGGYSINGMFYQMLIAEHNLLLATENFVPRFVKCNTYQSIIQAGKTDKNYRK